MSSLALSFNNVQFDIVDRNNQPWIKSRELAKALGYADEKSINRIYQRNADEFAPNMVGGVNLTTPSGEQETRIFSLRGCHLLAMFARTTIAKQFRKWVLDILDKEVQQPSTSDHDIITQTLSQISNGNKKLYMAMYNGLTRRFKVGRLGDIPTVEINKAIAVAYELALEWHSKNKPTLKLNDGEHYFVVKDGVVLWEKVLKPHCNDLPSNTLKNPALMLEHVREVVGEFIGKDTLAAPKPVLIADFPKKSVFEHKRQTQRYLLSLDVFFDGYGFDGNPLRRLFALLKQGQKDGRTIAVHDIEGAELVFSTTESLARKYKQSLDEISRHASNASDRGCYLPLQGC
jgi:prophage antirepressor-like protein